MMKTILVVNSKGGCGKSTLAANLASYYALWKVPVALVDYDPQQSALEWLAQRNAALPPIVGVDASVADATHRPAISADIQRVVMDSPARLPPQQLKRLFAAADCAILPVLPSPIDIRAAGHFIGELMLGDLLHRTPVGLVANRVRENTLIFHKLEQFLRRMKIPLITHLRDTQNYIRAAAAGHGIFEMSPYQVDQDIEQWRSLIKWIEGR